MNNNESNNINSQNDITTENDTEYLTLSDGTDISELDYKYRKMLSSLTRDRMVQWHNTEICYNILVEKLENNPDLPIIEGNYTFPDNMDSFFGYVVQIREHTKNNIKYKYLEILIENQIRTVRYIPKNAKDPIVQGISKAFGILFEEDDFFHNPILLKVKNRKNSLGEVTYSKITNFKFLKPFAIEALNKCDELLFGE